MSQEQNADVSLSFEQQSTFDHDVQDLQAAEAKHGMEGKLVGRTKFGLDPAGMMVVRDTAPLAENVAKGLRTDAEKVWPLIHELHEKGPWDFSERLSAASDPEIRTYLVLAAACQESAWPGYTPDKYLEDRKRVIADLSSFTPDQFEDRKHSLEASIQGFQDASTKVGEKEIKVAIVENDAALPLSTRGYKGCMLKREEMRFAQTSNIPDRLLEEEGLVKGFGEKYNPAMDGFDRVSPDTPGARIVWILKEEAGKPLAEMTPAVKRIAPGYVLAYKDEKLALNLVIKAVAEMS